MVDVVRLTHRALLNLCPFPWPSFSSPETELGCERLYMGVQLHEVCGSALLMAGQVGGAHWTLAHMAQMLTPLQTYTSLVYHRCLLRFAHGITTIVFMCKREV